MSFKSNKCFGLMSGKPVTSYESEEEALDGINYIKNNYKDSVPMISYECSKCGFYHLSPKSRQTESELCGCTNSDGDSIQLFDTRKSAKIRANKFRKDNNIPIYVYPCPNSTGFHITDEDPKDSNN